MDKVLVTGAAGFIGFSICNKLLEFGIDVCGLDNLNNYYDPRLKSARLEILTKKGMPFSKIDLADAEKVKKVFNSYKPTHVINLAAQAGVRYSLENPHAYINSNIIGFLNILENCKNNSVEHLIYASSSSVYGLKKERDVNESVSLEPLTDYSKFKAKCEDVLLQYKSNDFTPVIIRPATVCGFSPRQRLDLVVNILTNLAYHKRKISIFGGDQLRPNIHIKDMVRAYDLLVEAEKDKVSGEIFNAGYENQTVKELANIVKSNIGEDVILETTPTDDNRSYHISSKKIFSRLGFVTKFTIKDAVNELKAAFKEKKLINTLENDLYFNIKKVNNFKMKL